MRHLTYALRYAQLGLRVFPVHERDKVPMTANGFKDGTCDAGQISEWWAARPLANIGCAIPNDIVILDFDTADAMGQLKAQDRQMPSTAWAQTPRGRHYWYRHHLNNLRSISRDKNTPGLDIKAAGGYVVLPPSVHPSGARYEWGEALTTKGGVSLDRVTEAPEWLLDLLVSQDRSVVRASVDVGAVMDGLNKGDRNTELFRYACRLRGKNLSQDEAYALVSSAAAKCAPPLPQADVRRIIESAWKYAPSDVATAEPSVAALDEFEIVPIETLMGMDFPPASWLVPELISEGLHVLASSPKIGKSWMALNLALATASGGRFLGQYNVAQGDVLYLDLEQPRKKTQARIRALPGAWQAGVEFAWKWPRHDHGGFSKLDNWLLDHPGARLVVIDVLKKVIGRRPPGGNAYEVDYDLFAPLKEMADAREVTILGLHHDNKVLGEGDKLDKVSGSRGLVGVADGVLILNRPRGQEKGELFATGREIEDQTLPVLFDVGLRSWMIDEYSLALGSMRVPKSYDRVPT